MRKKTGWWFAIPLVMAVVAGAKAGDAFSDYFQRGKYEATLASGVMFSPIGADRGRHTVDYTLSALQFGWMVTEPGRATWWRGNLEVAAEVMGGDVFEGRGNYLAGGTAWLRYNFVQPNWRVIPYAQAGAGAEATDMDRRLIGERFNFNLGISAGTRFFVAPDWALNIECRYQHISNARISNHDIGINAVGPTLGLSFFF